MSILAQKLQGLLQRIRHLRYGIVYLFARDFRLPRSLWINGKFRKIHFLNSDSEAFSYEFDEICIKDCYHLGLLKEKLGAVNTIVDVGANQGLFLLAARKRFPSARLIGYEPNPSLREILSSNAGNLSAVYFEEAVTKESCRIKLHYSASDLHTQSEISETGDITGSSLRLVIERCGGSIDILKLDCEGAEWQLFNAAAAWEKINSLTMEYHLWANPGSTKEDIRNILTGLGYDILSHEPISSQFGLITAVRKKLTGIQ